MEHPMVHIVRSGNRMSSLRVCWMVLAQVVVLWLAVVGTDARRLPTNLWMDRNPAAGATTGGCFGGHCDVNNNPDSDAEPENAVQISAAKRTPLVRDVCRLLGDSRGEELFRSAVACGCETKYAPMDMGRGRYPRHIPAVECQSGAGLRCKTRLYQVAVITSRDEDNLHDDPKMPEALRGDWRFQFIDVPVACDCDL